MVYDMINILINNEEINYDEFRYNFNRYNLIKVNEKDNLITYVNKYNVDMVILDLVTPCMNFILGTRILKKYKPSLKVIVAVNFIQDSLIRFLYDNGVDYIVVRPLECISLGALLDNIFKHSESLQLFNGEKFNFEKKLVDTLNNLGMPANLKGYSYIKEAITLCNKNKDYYLHTTSLLYPKLSKIFKSKTTCIEKAIRGAIELCWIRGNIEEQERIFGYTVNRNKGRPTNGEFLAQLFNYIAVRQGG